MLIIAAVMALAAGCDLNKPVRVGFSGQLTGPHANMGVSGRDGVLLAIADINAGGGIAGSKVELLVRDDKGTSEGARVADQQLIDAGVVAIIGHMTSAQTMAALPVVEKAGMVLLSPTTSTPALTGRVDHFFRVISDSSSEARLLARHVVHKIGLERMAAIYDQDNAAYTRAYLDAFRDELQKLGGQMVGEVRYSSAEKPDFAPLVAQLRRDDPQGLLIIASAYDGALIAQQPRMLGWPTKLFGCGWTLSLPLIENGGKAVEGMGFIHYYDLNSQAPDYLKFQQKYQTRFKQTANFMAGNAYLAMRLLAAALEKTRGRAEGLAQALPGIRIEGLMEAISLDHYGDGVRAYYYIMVQDGRFVTLGKVEQ
jgi:branched-chain amino acid transport system substrate-binding protein